MGTTETLLTGDPVEDAVAACVVRVAGAVDGSRGSGFFVAPGLVLTCAHVVGRGRVVVSNDLAEDTHATVEKYSLGGADLALIRTSLRPSNQTGRAEDPRLAYVGLSDALRLGDHVAALGFPIQSGQHYWSRIEGTVEQLDHQHPHAPWRDGPRLIRFRNAQVEPGFSGAPLLNVETGMVVGVVTTTINPHDTLGGLAAPASRLLQEVEAVREAQRSVPPPRVECPYPGLPSFNETQSKFFCGREQEIDEIVALLHARTQRILLVGASGSGKSSLLAAGVVPAVKKFPRTLCVGPVRLATEPASRLCTAFGATDTDGCDVLRGVVLNQAADAERIIVFIDPLEELFTQTTASETRRFVELYIALIADPRVSVVFAIRADFYGTLLESPLWEQMDKRVALLTIAPIRGEGLRNAIELPAKRMGVEIDPALTEQLIQAAGNERGPLPLLQAALAALWNRREGREIKRTAFSGLSNAISNLATAAMLQLTPNQQLLARRILLRLVKVTGPTPTRQQRKLSELRTATNNQGAFEPTYRVLLEARLLTADITEPNHETVVDVAHEALLREWTDLADWITQRADDLRQREWLQSKAEEWDRLGRGVSETLDEVALADAERWVRSEGAGEIGYEADVAALIGASRSELARRKNLETRLQRRIIAGLTLFSIAVVVLSALVWRSRQEAVERQAEADLQRQVQRKALAASYLEQGRTQVINTHPMRALAYLIAARDAGEDGTVSRHLTARVGQPPLATLQHPTEVASAAFSADGRYIITFGEAPIQSNSVYLWDAHTKTLIKTFEHEHPVISAALSPEGTRLVVSCWDGTAHVWDVRTGRRMGSPVASQTRACEVNTASFSPGGRRLVTVEEDNAARVWDVETGRPLTPLLEHADLLLCAAFSPDGTRVITASWDQTARIWDASTGQSLAKLAHEARLIEAKFSPDGKSILTVSEDNAVRIWDASTGQLTGGPMRHIDATISEAFSPDGTRIITSSWDRTARIWSVTGGELLATLTHGTAVQVAAFSSDGKRFLTTDDAMVYIWDPATMQTVSMPLEHSNAVTSAAFSPDGAEIVTTTKDKRAWVWSARIENPREILLEHPDLVSSAVFSPGGDRIIASADNIVRIWDVNTGRAMGEMLKLRAKVISIEFNLTGDRVVIASEDGGVQVWDPTTWRPVGVVMKHKGRVNSATFNRDSTRVVTATYEHDQLRVIRRDDGTLAMSEGASRSVARIWDARTGEPITPPILQNEGLYQASFDGDGRRIVTAGAGGTSRIWNAYTGLPLGTQLRHQKAVSSAEFSPDGTRVITASWDHTARVWDAYSGRLLGTLEHDASVSSARFSHDGQHILTRSDDNRVHVWDARTWEPSGARLEHVGIVSSASFSRDDSLIVTSSFDKTVRIWDARTGQAIGAPLQHPTEASKAQFSIDGKHLLTVAGNYVRIWPMATDQSSMEHLRLRARCSPFVLANGILTLNREPAANCPAAQTPHEELVLDVLPTSSSDANQQRDLAVKYDEIGDARLTKGKLHEARTAYDNALAIRSTLVGTDPGNPDTQHSLLLSYDRIGNALFAGGDLIGARNTHSAALALALQAVKLHPSSEVAQNDVALAYYNASVVLIAEGNFDAAESMLVTGSGFAERSQLKNIQDAIQVEHRTLITRRQRQSDPCARVAATEAVYCGNTRQIGFPGGDSHILYRCGVGKTLSQYLCDTACVAAPYGTEDFCP